MRLRLLFLSWLCALFKESRAKHSIYAPTDTLIVHANAREGDEIVSDQPFRIAIDEDEDVALSFEPASDLISVFPAIVSPGRVIHFIITNPKLLTERVKENYKLQGLGLISGNLHEVPIRLEIHRSSSESNNRVPSFEQEVYLLKLEDNFKEREIAILKLTKSPPKDVWFQLIGPFAERFTVSNQHENVYITTLVCDRPCFIPDQITILVVASDGQSDSRTTVTFSLKSEDNISFLQNNYEAIVEEKTGHFKKAVKIEATGADHLIYSLQDETGLFVLHKSGILVVQHPEFLTQENYGEQINVTAIASDGKRTITKDIKVKIIPKQEYHYNFKFMKDSYYFVVHPGEKFVGLIAVENSRNESLEYRISEGGQGQFTIDKSGSLFFGGIAMRDTRNYTLQVIAQSHSLHFFVISTKVNVSIEGIHSYPLRVDGVVTTSSKIDSGSNVGTVISTWEFIDDDDDAKLLLSVEYVKALDMNGNEYTEKEVLENLITTEIRGKEGKLLLNKRIEDLPITVLSVAAKAEDTAHTRESPIIVHNEAFIMRKKPFTSMYSVPLKFLTVPEFIFVPVNTPVGSSVFQLTLLPNVFMRSYNYLFEMEKKSLVFSVDNSIGVIKTIRSLHGVNSELLHITATNKERKSAKIQLNIVVVKEKSDKHSFTEKKYLGSVKTKDPVGTVVFPFTIQNNHPPSKFTLLGEDSSFFEVDNKGALSTKRLLNNVSQTTLSFLVTTEDIVGKSVVAPVLIYIDNDLDQVPQFEKSSYYVTVMENLPRNSFILQPQIIQESSTSIEYSIEIDNHSTMLIDLLDIDDEGRITNKNELLGFDGRHTFNIQASTKTHFATCSVLMIIQPAYKCVPAFIKGTNYIFEIQENLSSNSEIGSVKAQPLDEKCDMKYLFWDPVSHKYANETSIALINSTSGEIRSKIIFDYEKEQSHPIILALQAGRYQFVQLASEIQVVDVDDHQLRFEISLIPIEISEDTPVGSVITTMRAFDQDTSQKLFYRLKPELEEIKINASNGQISLALPLDREREKQYRIQVGVFNTEGEEFNNKTVSATLVINVKDVNDNGPIFEHEIYDVLLPSSSLPGRRLITVNAFDPDEMNSIDDMRYVYYSIKETTFNYRGVSHSIEGFFTIDQVTGEIRIEQGVSDFVGGMFHIRLESADSIDENAHRGTCSVQIYVYSESDIVHLDMPYNPMELNISQIEQMKQSISNLTTLNVMVKDVLYHHIDGQVVNDVTDLRLVFINESTFEIIAAEKALAVIDRYRSMMGNTIPTMTKAQTVSSLHHYNLPPVLMVLGVFSILLIIVLVMLGLSMCYYRSKFRIERRLYEDEVIITSALNRPPDRSLINTSPNMQDKFNNHASRGRDYYTVQEKKMVVGADGDERRKRH